MTLLFQRNLRFETVKMTTKQCRYKILFKIIQTWTKQTLLISNKCYLPAPFPFLLVFTATPEAMLYCIISVNETLQYSGHVMSDQWCMIDDLKKEKRNDGKILFKNIKYFFCSVYNFLLSFWYQDICCFSEMSKQNLNTDTCLHSRNEHNSKKIKIGV